MLIVALVLIVAGGASAAERLVKPVLPIAPPMRTSTTLVVSPKMLPPTKQTPVSLRTSSTFWMEDGSQLPAVSELRLSFDRHLRLQLEDIPACRSGIRSQVRGNGPDKTCPDSIVGRGRLTTEVSFPDQAPVSLTSKVTIVKGHSQGRTATLYLHTYFSAPVTAEIITTVKVKPVADSVYGLEAVATIPKIAGGAGSVTHIGLRFRKGIFTAICPSKGRLQIQQQALFADGTFLQGAVVRPCEQTG
jgi:hypothetical protein